MLLLSPALGLGEKASRSSAREPLKPRLFPNRIKVAAVV